MSGWWARMRSLWHLVRGQDQRGRKLRWMAGLLRPYRGRVALTLVAILAATGAALAPPFLAGEAIDAGIVAGDTAALTLIVVAFLAVALLYAAATYAQTYLVGWVGTRALQDLRERVFSHLQSMSIGFFTRRSPGVLISRMTNDIEALNQLVTSGAVTLLSSGLTLIGVVAIMLALDLTAEECAERVAAGYSAASMLEKLVGERRAALVRIGGEERYVAGEDAGLYRDALGVPPPPGLPETFLEDHPDAMRALVRRYARTHGPFPTAQLADRYGVDPTPALRELEREGALVRGELLPGGSEREWCDAGVLRRVRRASLAHLRREVEPAARDRFARFLPGWQNVDSHRAAGAGPDRLRDALVPLQGVALTPKVWEGDVLPRRLGAYSPAWLDELCTSGELVWIGAGARGRGDGRVALYFREDVRLAGPPPANAKLERAEGAAHDAIRERLGAGPSFWLDLLADLEPPAEELHNALWDLAWSGEVTNDAFAPLRVPRLRSVPSHERQGRRFARRRSGAGAAVQGRWSLTAPLFEGAPGPGAKLRAQAELMLERYGIVTRETVLAEGVPGGFASLYAELGNLELLGTARRGYFVEGLGGAQFALPGAVERLRSLPEESGAFQLLAATDPANPYGAALPWPKPASGRRPGRAPGAHVLLRDGEPLVYLERGGRSILRLAELDGEALGEAMAALVEAVSAGRLPKLGIEKLDGEPLIGSGHEEALLGAGFSRGPRKLIASAR